MSELGLELAVEAEEEVVHPRLGNSAVQNVIPPYGNGTSSVGDCENQDTSINDAYAPLWRKRSSASTYSWQLLRHGRTGTCDISGLGPSKSNDLTYPPGSGLTTGGVRGGSGCTPCGSKSSSGLPGGVNYRMRADGVMRFFVPNNRANNSSFSPGHYSQFDNQLDFFPDTSFFGKCRDVLRCIGSESVSICGWRGW